MEKSITRHVLEVCVWGLAIGVPLAIGAYMFLYVQGQQILGEEHANNVERAYIEARETNFSSYLGSVVLADGDDYDVQDAYGRNHYQNTYNPQAENYDPQSAEEVTFNGHHATYDGVQVN